VKNTGSPAASAFATPMPNIMPVQCAIALFNHARALQKHRNECSLVFTAVPDLV
jgi:hypothetical protein